jgi:hypothetical protein
VVLGMLQCTNIMNMSVVEECSSYVGRLDCQSIYQLESGCSINLENPVFVFETFVKPACPGIVHPELPGVAVTPSNYGESLAMTETARYSAWHCVTVGI